MTHQHRPFGSFCCHARDWQEQGESRAEHDTAVSFGTCGPAGTNCRLRLSDSSSHPKSQLFPLFCCRDPTAVQWWAVSSQEVATALSLKSLRGSRGLQIPQDWESPWRPPPCYIPAWYSPGQVNVPELPWPCWECLKGGVILIVILGSLITSLLKLLRILSEAEQFQADFSRS